MLDRVTFYASFLFVLACAACSVDAAEPMSSARGGSSNAPPPGQDAEAPDAEAACAFGQVICVGDTAKVCDGRGGFGKTQTCPGDCTNGLGCVRCVPMAETCSNGVATVCDVTGAKQTRVACQ